MKKICIIGASGFAKEVYWLAKDLGLLDQICCFMEPDSTWSERELYGKPILKQSEFDEGKHKVILGIGDPRLREKIVNNQMPINSEYISLIHPKSLISNWVKIGRGAIICAGNIITCDIKIGDFSLINLNCTIGHDCEIGDYFNLNPGVNVSGNCIIGDKVNIGTNASIRQGIKICDNVIIGMGASVVKDIKEAGVYVGNPAKILIK